MGAGQVQRGPGGGGSCMRRTSYEGLIDELRYYPVGSTDIAEKFESRE